METPLCLLRGQRVGEMHQISFLCGSDITVWHFWPVFNPDESQSVSTADVMDTREFP